MLKNRRTESLDVFRGYVIPTAHEGQGLERWNGLDQGARRDPLQSSGIVSDVAGNIDQALMNLLRNGDLFTEDGAGFDHVTTENSR